MAKFTATAIPEDDRRSKSRPHAIPFTAFSDELVPLDEAGRYFPKPLKKKALYKRIHEGIEGVRLGAVYDGYRYYTSQERVRKFLQDVSDAQNRRFQRLCAPTLTDDEEYQIAIARLNAL